MKTIIVSVIGMHVVFGLCKGGVSEVKTEDHDEEGDGKS